MKYPQGPCGVQLSDMPSKQTKRPGVTQGCNEALDLLLMQEYADKVTRTKIALEEIQAMVHGKTILANLSSAQDRRTLNTAYSCLNSLRIRMEAHVNSVEQSVIQRQLSLVQTIGHCRPQTTNTQDVPRSDSGVSPQFQTSNYLEHPAHRSIPACEPSK